MKYSHLFRGIDFTDSEALNKLNNRIETVVDDATNFVSNPFRYDGEFQAYFCDPTQYDMPNGGYLTLEQAEIALGLWKAKNSLTYQELYKLSKFIWQGLQ